MLGLAVGEYLGPLSEMMDKSEEKRQPLSGLKVLDFGQYIAGPAAAMILSDQGADVVHVDPPGGPCWKNPADAILNRGKARLSLNLKDTHDREVAMELAREADVLIENFRPGVMDRFGLGPSEIQEVNPSVVYLSLPGFSAADDENAKTAAWEGVIAASVGQFTDMGLNRILMGINPSFSPLPLASAYAAVLGAASVTFALFARQQSGQGDVIEVPISSAMMEGLAYNSMHIEELPDRYKSPRELEIEKRRRRRQPFDLSYSDLQEYLDPFYRTYTCKDGRLFYLVCASHIRHPIKCLELLGLWDEIRAASIPTHDAYLNTADWPDGQDCTIQNYPLSNYWREFVGEKMKAAFRTRAAYEWEEIFGRGGVPGCAHQTTQEWINSNHALSSGNILEVGDPRFGWMRQMGNICWLADDPAVLEKSPAEDPDRPEHSPEEILERWRNADESQPDPAHSTGTTRWLDGVRVLDLTNVIAGPTAGCLLSRFGAEVLKIDPTRPTMDPWNTIVFGMQANQNKKSVLLDLSSEFGKSVLEKLLPDIDVVTINATEDQLERLGLTIEDLHRINPNIILCRIDAFGGPASGPRSSYRGYDDLVQAATGIMSRFGGIETPEEHAHLGTIDVLCGFSAALSVGIALVDRKNAGGGRLARSSLAAAGQLIQLPFMYDYESRRPFDEPSGRDVKGVDPFYRCYEAEDGWFFLAAMHGDRQQALADATDPSIGDLSEISQVEERLEVLLRSRRLSHWVRRFEDTEITCQPLATMSQVRDACKMTFTAVTDLREEIGCVFHQDPDHPCGHSVEMIAPIAIRPRNSEIRLPQPMPKYGAHTIQTLNALGYTDRQIQHAIQAGFAATQWCDDYLPG